MSLLSTPDPTVVLAEIAPLIPVLYTACESAAVQSHGYFRGDGSGKVDRDLYINLVRYHARKHLFSQSERLGYTLARLNNNGIELQFSAAYFNYKIKVLKACSSRIVQATPAVPAAKTLSRQRFYRNGGVIQHLLPFTGDELWPESWRRRTVDLVILWEPDPCTHNLLVPLTLVCPSGSVARKVRTGALNLATVEYYWFENIPHPATIAQTTASPNVAAGRGDEDDDLDMTLVIDEQTERGHAT